jgi:hypothetical protein
VADIYSTRIELEDIFWTSTMTMLGYDPADYNDPLNIPAFMPVRISWQPEGVPAWKRTDDVTFIRIGEEDDLINVLHDLIYTNKDADNSNQATSYTRVVRVHYICYGPNSYDNAFKLKRLMFNDTYRLPLIKQNLYLVPSKASPIRSPELFTGQWWERADIAFQFNEFVKFNDTVPYIKSTEMTLSVDSNGVITNKDISI